jgi:hypothetical protein
MYGNMTVRASPKAKASTSPPFWHNSHVDVLVTSHKLRTLPGRFVFAHGPTSEPARPDQLHAGSYTRYPKWLDLWSSTSFGNTSVTLVTPGGELCYGTLQHPLGGGLSTTTPQGPMVPQRDSVRVSFRYGPIRPQMAKANAQGRSLEGAANWPTWEMRSLTISPWDVLRGRLITRGESRRHGTLGVMTPHIQACLWHAYIGR